MSENEYSDYTGDGFKPAALTTERNVVCGVCTMNRADEIDREAFINWWVEIKYDKRIYYCPDHLPDRLKIQ